MNHHPLADAVPSGIAGGGQGTKTHCELWAEALGEEEDSISAGPRCSSLLSPVTRAAGWTQRQTTPKA